MKFAIGAVCACLLATGFAACGDDDDGTTTTPETTTAETGATGPGETTTTTSADATGTSGPVTPDELISCLGDTGVEATLNPNLLAGIDGDYETLQVDGENVAVVFTDPADAEAQENSAGIYVDGASTLAGNVIYGGTGQAREALETCVPSG